jgi:hypothetical protein
MTISFHRVSIGEFVDELDRHLHWYNETRIKKSLGWMSPIEDRESLGFAAWAESRKMSAAPINRLYCKMQAVHSRKSKAQRTEKRNVA